MAHLLVRNKVQDYAAWKAVFDEHDGMRRANGGGNYQLFRSANDPNDITILAEWDSIENAQRFAASTDLREAMMKAGVVGQPDVVFLNKV